MKELLISLASGLVENPDQVVVTVDEPTAEGVIVYHLHVAEQDVVMRAAANRNNQSISVEID